MRKKTCHLENEVLNCLNKERMNPEIKKHINECPVCKETVTVFNWMNQFKNTSWNAEIIEKNLPDPKSIWNRANAKWRPERKIVKKALRPMIYPEILSYMVAVSGIIFLFFSKTKDIGNILNLNTSLLTRLFPLFLFPAIIILISMLFCFFTASLEKRKKTA